MSTRYDLPDPEVRELLDQVLVTYHPRLLDAKVRIGLIMALAEVDEKTGDPSGPALKGYGGAPAAAKIKIVPLKDRLVKNYDVELILDGDSWPVRNEQENVALLDHELTHILLTGKVDDLGRPKLKLREEDFIVWGFLEVVKRHGARALEAQSMRRLVEMHGTLLLGYDAEIQTTELEEEPQVQE